MAIPAGTTFHGLSPLVQTKNRGSAQSNSLRDAYAIEDFKSSEASVENNNVSGTYEIDLNIANHELTLTGATTLGVTNTPSVGETVVVTLYITSAVDQALTIPSGWTQYGGTYAADATRNQLALCVSNNAVSGLVFDLSTSVQI